MAQPTQPIVHPRLRRRLARGIALVGVVGLLACDGNKAPAAAGKTQGAASSAQASGTVTVTELEQRTERARESLDTVTLAKTELELASLADDTDQPKRVQRARLRALTALAVEATVRAEALDDAQARGQAEEFATKGSALLASLGDTLDPGERQTAAARLALAQGQPVADTHPAVLLPSFRDRELQNAVLSEPLWRPSEGDDALSEQERTDLVESLEQSETPTGLETMLLAVAVQATGDTKRAESIAQKALARAPQQALASGLIAKVRTDSQVAVAVPPEVPPKAEPVVEPDPTPTPAVEPSPPTTPDPVAEPPKPEPTKPEPTPAKPTPTTDKPKPKPTKPKPSAGSKPGKKTPAQFTEEGCALVRRGDAKKGFAMLQRAFDLNPRDNKVTLCMAEGHLKLGRLPSGRAMAERVLRSSPKNKRALMLAAKIETKLGNKRAAVQYYERVLAIDPGNTTAKNYVDANG